MQGSCHCGAVTYQVDGNVEGVIHCHCDTCRKISGTAFSSNVFAPKEALTILAGQDKLTAYESSPDKYRWFCNLCGSHIYACSHTKPDLVFLRVGTCDDDPGVKSAKHIWVSQTPAWDDNTSDLPQFEKWVTAS